MNCSKLLEEQDKLPGWQVTCIYYILWNYVNVQATSILGKGPHTIPWAFAAFNGC